LWLVSLIPNLVQLLNYDMTDKLYAEVLFIISNLAFKNKSVLLETNLLSRIYKIMGMESLKLTKKESAITLVNLLHQASEYEAELIFD